jgi:serine/threonine-protein kinase
LLATIGKGGMASVILARQRGPAGFEKTVVIKVIHPHMASDRAAINMLLDEARVAAQIDHPNVVHTYELGEAHGTFYIVMEYLAGESFARVLKKAAAKVPPPLAPALAGRIVADAAAGLSAAHDLIGVDGRPLEIVHRDVSPGNIVVLYNGAVKVVDFGIAKAQGRVTSTQDGELKGKYGYMSPEQIRNEVMDRRSDVFSLGVVLWESLALRRLFQADNVAATLMQILTSQRVPPSTFQPEVPRELDQIALQALAPDPRDRFQTMAEMQKAIEDAIWQTRCGAQEVQTQMQWWFSDRIEQRRGLLARATQADMPALTDADVDQLGQAFNNQSSRSMPTPLSGMPVIAPPGPMTMRPYPTPSMQHRAVRSNNRRTVFAIATLGTIAGVLAAVLVTGDADDDKTTDQVDPGSGSAIAKLEPAAKQPTAEPIEPARPEPPPTRPATPRPDEPAPIEENATRPDVKLPAPRAEETKPDEPVKKPPPAGDKKPDPPKRPDDPPRRSNDELYKQASEKYIGGDLATAESLYKQILAQAPTHAGAHKGLGFIYQLRGVKAKALVHLRTYLKLAPSAPDAARVRKRIQEME